MQCPKAVTTYILPQKKRDKNIELASNLKEAVLDVDQPKWKYLPLDVKVPIFPSPKKAYRFARQKVGKKLRVDLPNAKFNLNDPWNREIDSSYNALHDKHLAHFFSRPNNKKFLKKVGLINSRLDVNCSPIEYNQQRMYWRKILGQIMEDEMQKNDELYDENRMLEVSENMARKQAQKLQILDERKKRAEELRHLNESNRMKYLQNKERQWMKRLHEFVRMKEEEYEMRRNKMETKMMHVQRTRDLAKLIEKCRRLTILQERKKKDRKRTMEKEIRVAQRESKKIMDVNNRWEKKKVFQENQIEKEQKLLSCAQKEREKHIEEYNEKIKKKRDMDQRKFQIIKNKLKLEKRMKLKVATSKSKCSAKLSSKKKKIISKKQKDKLKSNPKRVKVKKKEKSVPKTEKLFPLVNNLSEQCTCQSESSK